MERSTNDGQLLVIDVASIPQPALMERAREVAAGLSLGVYICCLRDEADLPPPLPGKRQRVQDVRAKLLSRCRRSLERRLDAMNAEGIDADGCVKQTDSAGNTALELAREHSPAFVMIGSRPHTRFEQATLSGDDFALIRACPVPVWIVNRSGISGDKIVAAVGKPEPGHDGASLDDRILDEASRLAQKLGKESHALHAFGEAGTVSPPVEPAAGNPGDDMGTSRNDNRIRKILDLVEAHGVAADHAHIYEGKLERVLEEELEPMNADLIVLGGGSDGRFKRMLSGGGAERLLAHIGTDVLILKGDEARANL